MPLEISENLPAGAKVFVCSGVLKLDRLPENKLCFYMAASGKNGGWGQD